MAQAGPMSIIGSTPETGMRIDVIRPREGAPPWRYAGEAVTSAARFAVAATVTAEGEVVVELGTDAPEGVGERVRLLMRAAYKHAREDGQPPPRRIVRWRAEVALASPRRGG
jgi:hypothetical protein